MPYVVVHENDEYCVYKQDANEQPTGDSMGCHATEAEAKAQVTAIMQNEGDMAKEMSLNETVEKVSEAFYAAIGPLMICEIEEVYPDSLIAEIDDAYWRVGYTGTPETGFQFAPRSEWEAVEETWSVIGTPGDVGMLRSLAGKLTGKRETNEMQIVRSKQGPRLAVIFTSNGYKDREDEHVATAALKAYTDACWSDTNWLGSGNQHLYWHDETLEIGEIIYADMVDGFLMEVSRELQTPVAKAVWDYMETEPHGASHGFRVLAREGDTFTRIAKRETSSLPIAAAANVGTLTEVIMADQDKARSSRLDDIFGITGAADILRERGPAGLNQALAQAGVEAKALTDTEVAQADVAKAAGDFGQLVTQLIDAMSELVTTQDALQAQVATVTETETETGKALKALTDELAKMKAELSLTPRRAAQSPALSDADAAKVKQQSPTEYDTFFAGLNIPKGGL